MRLRLGAAEDCSGDSVYVLDPATSTWVSLVDAVKVRKRKIEPDATRDIVALLALSLEERAVVADVAALAAAKKGKATPPPDRVPVTATSLRDAALFTKHMVDATKGFLPVALACGHAIQLVMGVVLAKKLRLPRALGPCGVPPYYTGNPKTIIKSGATSRWPSYVGKMDYELEVALINGATVSDEPSEEECARAVLEHGGFVLINDFSARDVQADEMTSVGFGFVKCKSFCTAMGSEVVTCDEFWAPGETGRLFDAPGLKAEVFVDGERWGPAGTTAEHKCCGIAAYAQHAARGEGLQPGEVLGLGTVPGCCGLEIGKWLKPGSTVEVRVEGLGSVTNVVGTPPPGANFRDLGRSAGQPTRLQTFVKLCVLAVVGPPLVFVLMVGGAAAALLWGGPQA
mmetsp:Transcript_15681/g.48536  ORF Transcript_15681/g.48536 Transcript_15681/m.48536 type:complete len:399 (+) Transcript_15681:914-2110(+)